MLEGCVSWPADVAARYRRQGWWEGITIPQLLERSAARHPGNHRICRWLVTQMIWRK